MASPNTNISRGFARSEQLQGQWDNLRTQLQEATDGGDDTLVTSLQRRMESIKLEMADLVLRTKKNLPVLVDGESEDDHDEHDLAQALVHHHSKRESLSPSGTDAVQYSAHRRHIVRRTYDSTDDEGGSSSSARNSEIDTAELRKQLMRTADHVDAVVMTVEHGNSQNSSASSAGRQLAASLKKGLKGAFKQSRALNSTASIRSASIHSCASTDEKQVRQDLAEEEDIRNDVNSLHGDYNSHAHDDVPSPAPTPPSSVRDDDDLDDLSIPGNGGGGGSSSTAGSGSARPFKDRAKSPASGARKGGKPLHMPIGTKRNNSGHGHLGNHNLGSSMTYLGPLTQEERESLAMEQSRLERESRRLRRKPDRTKTDDNRLLDIASRLSKLSSTLADNVTVRSLRTPRTPNAQLSSLMGTGAGGGKDIQQQQALSPRGQQPDLAKLNALVKTVDVPTRKVSRNNRAALQNKNSAPLKPKAHLGAHPQKTDTNVLSPLTDDGTSNGNGGSSFQGPSSDRNRERVPKYSDGNPSNATSQPIASASSSHGHLRTPNSGKRKKTWMAIEAGMNSLKTLGRSVRNTALHGHGHGDVGRKGSANSDSQRKKNQANNAASAVEEVKEKIAERGEKLNGTADATERMANDAGDFLAAARALRVQQQNKGFFS